MTKAQQEIKLKLNALNHSKTSKSVTQTCKRFGISGRWYRYAGSPARYGIGHIGI